MKRFLSAALLALISACGFNPVAEYAEVSPPPFEWKPGTVPCPGHTPAFAPDFTAAEWPEAAARALCDRGVDCCSTSVSAYEACVVRERAAIGARSLEARIAAGLVSIDLPKARACLMAWAAERSCSPRRRVPACLSGASAELVKPAVDGGGRCLENADCTSGKCIRDPGACGGSCAPTAKVGELCDPRSLPCDLATGWCPDPGTAPDRRCLPLRAEGEGCPGSEACVDGTWCGGGVCRRFIGEGEACVERQDRCAAGLACAGGLCAREGWRSEGMACDATEDCSDGLRCDGGSLRCVRVHVGGERCASGADCSAIGFCHPQGWCAPKRGQHQPCESGAWCMEGLECVDGECWPPSDAAEACTSELQCRYPLVCRSGSCGMPAAIGDGCATPNDCESGRCVDGSCAPMLREGESCQSSVQCVSAACVAGVDGDMRCAGSCLP